jgi:hypothetical protein
MYVSKNVHFVWYLYTMEFYSAIKIMKFCCLQVNGWNQRTGSESQRPHVFSHMWNIGPIQMQQYYEKQVTLREREVKEGS